MRVNTRMRFIAAGACAVVAALLTLVYLGGQSSAGPAETEVIWVALQPVEPGTQLSEAMLRRVRVDGPTRKLLAREALPSSPSDSPGAWYAIARLEPGEPLLPGRNVATQPAPDLPDGAELDQMRLVALLVDEVPASGAIAGEEVDIYVIPKGREAIRILERTRVVIDDEGLLAVLVPEDQVANVLTAAEGAQVKVVRHPVRSTP